MWSPAITLGPNHPSKRSFFSLIFGYFSITLSVLSINSLPNRSWQVNRGHAPNYFDIKIDR